MSHTPGVDCSPKTDENGVVIDSRCPVCLTIGIIVPVCSDCGSKNETASKKKYDFPVHTFELPERCKECTEKSA